MLYHYLLDMPALHYLFGLILDLAHVYWEFQVSTQHTPLGAQQSLKIRITDNEIIITGTNLVPTKTMPETLPVIINKVFKNMTKVDL